MRIILGFLCGIIGMLAGWVGLALVVIAIAGESHDGGTAMGAFFGIGPIGGVIGLVAGTMLFLKIGLVRSAPASNPAPTGEVATLPRSRISRPYATIILVIVG